MITFPELPQSVTTQKDANYVDERVPGRTEPWKTYSDSNSEMIDFEIKLVATGTSSTPKGLASARATAGAALSVGGQVANRFGVDGVLGRVVTVGGLLKDTFASDFISGSGDRSGERAAIIFNEVTRKAAALKALTFAQYDDNGLAFPPPLIDLHYGMNFVSRGVVKSVRLRYLGPWEPTTGLCMRIDCNVTMEEVNLVPKSYRDVRDKLVSGTGSAGQIQTFARTPRNLLFNARSTFGL
jgi:hypothetical protein